MMRQDRMPAPIDPAEVRPGQIIEVEAAKWSVKGLVVAVDESAREIASDLGARYIAIGNGDDFTVWPKLKDSIVWMIKDNPEVEALQQMYDDAEQAVTDDDGAFRPRDLVRELYKRGMRAPGGTT